MSASPGPSAYAVPNSPIASANRARCPSTPKIVYSSSPDLQSPISRKCETNSTAPTDGSCAKLMALLLLPLIFIGNMLKASFLLSFFMVTANTTQSQSHDDDSDTSSQLNSKNRSEVSSTPSALFSPNLQKTDDLVETGTSPAEVSDDECDEIDQHEDDVFNPYLFIAMLPEDSGSQLTCLPPKDSRCQKRTLVLDLDETLVHCCVEPIENPDIVFPVTFNGNFYQVYVRKRPYLDKFLEIVSKQYEVIVFTASQKVYANTLLNLIDPENKYFHHRLFREACVLVHGNYLKDLSVLDRDLSKSVLVDNSPHAYGFQIDNGIPIESWFDDDDDCELLSLLDFLDSMNAVEDVRPFIRDRFRTYKLVNKWRGTLRKLNKGVI